jgi:hypothetical protein
MTVTNRTPRAVSIETGDDADRCNFCTAESPRDDHVFGLRLIRETEDKPQFYEFRACGRHLDRLASDLFHVSLERSGG